MNSAIVLYPIDIGKRMQRYYRMACSGIYSTTGT